MKPQEPGLARAPENSNGNDKHHLDLIPAMDVQIIQKAVQEVAGQVLQRWSFSTDADTGRVVVKITDTATGELVRQIPMEEMLALAKSLDRLQGLLLQTKA